MNALSPSDKFKYYCGNRNNGNCTMVNNYCFEWHCIRFAMGSPC